ncbi:OB-fold putative lipoprotein [Providencia rettgeri]|uniref:OB-fold putative lipoprotein n=1 Tax=Providencia rettgeri TaxID=587 RepID=UPI001CA6EEBB|nr:OB-fold putative lipoprotein [Providencia rettgeri]QZY62668.1 OB-fold putative lipoprotein [Providencia rettgeri]
MYKKVLIVSLIALVSGCQQVNGMLDSVNNTLGQMNSALEPNATEVTQLEMCQDFKDNEIAANKKWIGQWVIMKGKTSIISDDQYGFYGQAVHISFNRKDSAAFTLKPTEESKIVKIKKGQELKLKGQITGFSYTMGCLIHLDKGTIQ